MMPLILDAKQFSMMAILLLFSPVTGLKQLYHPNQNTQMGRLNVENDNHSKGELVNLLTSKRVCVHDLNCLRRDRGNIMKLSASKNEFNFETVKGKSQDNIANRNQLRDGHLYVPQGMHANLFRINLHITLLLASAIHMERKCGRWCDGQGNGKASKW